MHVKKKDKVIVIAGKDKGREGRVLSIDTTKGRATVERVNMVKKHARANPRQGVQGGIIEQEASIDVSNLMLVCDSCGPTRAKSERKDGHGVRKCRKCGTAVGE
jgi:large subunit ribosomal protein L24